MTTPARTPGLRGRLPVKPPAERFPIKYLSAYLREPLPAPSYPVDVTGGITDNAWQMLGNGPDPTCTTHPDGVGDCTFAGRQHLKMAKAANYGETEQWETSNQLVAEYLAYDNGQDQGAVIADLLLSWYKSGKILAFAPVDHTDPVAIDSAMQAFKGVYCGVNLTDDADDLFGEGQPWTLANGEQPDPDDGHCVVKLKADGHELDWYGTWGALQAATRAWSGACVVECWVLITSEDEAAKVAMAALVADIEALHGTGPAPGPAPVPPPPPAPVPPDPNGLLGELAALIRGLASSAQQDITELLAFLASHGL